MSIQSIKALERKMSRRAKAEGLSPYVVTPAVLASWKQKVAAGQLPHLPFPWLGTYKPRGWKKALRGDLFVDKTGWGDENEPALTVKQLIDELRPWRGYAIVEEGQFQCYIREYLPPSLLEDDREDM